MHAHKPVPAVIALVAVVCLLFTGHAHGLEEYVPAAVASKQVEEPLATNQNKQFLPQPEVMPVPIHLLKRPGFAVYAPQREEKTTQQADAALVGELRSASSYFPEEPTTTTTTTTEPEAEPAAETTTEPEPAPETTTEDEPAPETTTEPEPTPETRTEPEPAPATTTEPEPVTPTAPGQGDFYRTGETPTKPEPPARPSSSANFSYSGGGGGGASKQVDDKPEPPATPSSSASFSYSGGGGGASKQVDDDGEPVDGLSPKAIANILKEHNVFRAKEHVPPLTWNETVAKYAQHYANERKGDCALKHSQGGPYGENLMFGEGKAWTWRHTVDEWSNEKKNYHYGPNSCDAGKMCGHYTAVVWKDTTGVGCGRVTCTDGNTLMVCSYYPPGNYDGEKPY